MHQLIDFIKIYFFFSEILYFIFSINVSNLLEASCELSGPPTYSNVINTINVQKRSKDIGKIIHVTSGVQP